MDEWDEKERRSSDREAVNHKIGKYLLFLTLIGTAFYMAYLIPEFIPKI